MQFSGITTIQRHKWVKSDMNMCEWRVNNIRYDKLGKFDCQECCSSDPQHWHVQADIDDANVKRYLIKSGAMHSNYDA